MDKKIGVLGGMGPMASQLFYKLVTEKTAADCDQDHVRMVIYSDSSMPDRTGAILSGEYDKVYSQLLEDAKVLENCGCEAICITCNTAHFFGEMMVDQLKVPFIHMIKETVDAIARETPGAKVAVLATDGTIKNIWKRRGLQLMRRLRKYKRKSCIRFMTELRVDLSGMQPLGIELKKR